MFISSDLEAVRTTDLTAVSGTDGPASGLAGVGPWIPARPSPWTPRLSSGHDPATGSVPLWPGLLLTLLLPGSGFSYLGRVWAHLGALTLTLLAWGLSWTLLLTAVAGGPGHTPLAPPPARGLEVLALLLVLGTYSALGWRYLRAHRARVARRLHPWRWLPIALHALLLALGVWWALIRLNPPY